MKAKKTSKSQLVGREGEFLRLRACLDAQKNVLLEGPVGVGKTRLAQEVVASLGQKVFRVDGDGRYNEQKLTGWFDPPTVLKKGYTKAAFQAGPLVKAMQEGGVLFINEMNRLPEGVQNVLLPAIDERFIEVPRLGVVRAAPSFKVIATQNPKEFVATSHLSEALLDRFELVVLDYQTEDEEIEIVKRHFPKGSSRASLPPLIDELARYSVGLVRLTRNHPRIRRGASVRAAMSVAEIAHAFCLAAEKGEKVTTREALRLAAIMALPTRIEMERDAEANLSYKEELTQLIDELLQELFEKKKRD